MSEGSSGVDNRPKQQNHQHWIQRHSQRHHKLLQRRMSGLQQQLKNRHRSAQLPLHPRLVQLHPQGWHNRNPRHHPLLHQTAMPMVRQADHPRPHKIRHLHTLPVQFPRALKPQPRQKDLADGRSRGHLTRHPL